MGGGHSRPRRNPAMDALEARLREQEAARIRSEQQAAEARQQAERLRLEQERQRQRAIEAARQAERARQQAELRAEQNRREREQAEREKLEAYRRAQEGEERARLERELAEQERRNREQAERDKQEAERLAKEAADRAAHERELAERARIAKEEADIAAQRAREEAEKAKEDLANGIQPVTWPTAEEYNHILRDRQYQEGMFHFAIAGLSGSGKSSLVNAFRGIVNETPGSAATGATETTLAVGRYPDTNPGRPVIWYDIPGAGTLTIKDWDYFNKQGLYIFDAIVVLFDNRFTATDVAILRNCARWKIPSFIVRSKSDSQVENLKNTIIDKAEADETLDEEERDELIESAEERATEQYTTMTRQSVKRNLREAGLEDQRVYLVSYKALLTITATARRRNLRGVRCLDERDLMADILKAAKERRCPPTGESDTSSMSGTNAVLARWTNIVGSPGAQEH
ncbi:hypothetical protein VKT23_013446 [Stygiomarasmius scandens]|uniref:IRG-type G domain-containing protein n=1 Tax=Marasmiellus scandens TaxID=2682957 RepID=A0ABR1J613_9AGAR